MNCQICGIEEPKDYSNPVLIIFHFREYNIIHECIQCKNCTKWSIDYFGINMDQNFLQLVDNYLSSISNLPSFTITSTWRSPEQNQAVGGVPNSYHNDAKYELKNWRKNIIEPTKLEFLCEDCYLNL